MQSLFATPRLLLPALAACLSLLVASPASAGFNVTISSVLPSSGGEFNKGRWLPTGSPSVISVGDLLEQLNNGDVTIETTGKALEPGNIVIQSLIPLDDLPTSRARSLALNALNNIVINGALSQATKGGDDKPNHLRLDLNANADRGGGGSIQVNANVDLAGGAFQATGDAFALLGNTTTTTGGGVFIVNVAGPVTLAEGILNTGGGKITIDAGATLSSTLGRFDSLGGIVELGAVTSIVISSPVTTSGGNFSAHVSGTGTLSVQNDIVTSGGHIALSTANGLIQSTIGADLDARFGANVGGVTVQSFAATGSVTLGGRVESAGGGTTLRAGGSLTMNDGISSSAGPVIASGDAITLNAPVYGGGGINFSGGSVTGNAGGSLTTQNSPIAISTTGIADIIGAIESNGGPITIQAGTLLDLGIGMLSSGGGAISLTSGNAMNLFGPISSSGGNITGHVTAAGALSVLNDITSSGGNIEFSTANGLLRSTLAADIDASGGAGMASVRLESLNASGALTLNGSVTAAAGSLTLRAGGDLTLNDRLANGRGTVLIHANLDGGALGNLSINAPVDLPFASSVSLQGVNFTQSGTGTLATGPLAGTFTGTATISRALTSAAGAITLSAPSLVFGAPVSGGGGITLNGGSVTGNAGGSLTSQNRPIAITTTGSIDIISAIQSNGGPITVQAGTTLDLGAGQLDSSGGVISLASANTMNLFGPMTSSGGSVTARVTGAGALNIHNDITSSGGNIEFSTANGLLQSTAGADVDASGGAGTASVRLESLNASGVLTVNGSVMGAAGTMTLRAGGDLTVNARLDVSSGAVSLHANTDGGGLGNLLINAPINLPSASSISLQGVQFTQAGTGTVTAGSMAGTFTGTATISRAITSANGAITLSAPSLVFSAPLSGGGGITLNGGSVTGNAGGSLTAQNRPIAITTTGSTDIIGTLESNGGSITVQAGTTLDLGVGVLSSGGGGINLASVNTMNLFGPLISSGGNITARVTGAGALNVQNDITSSGGNIDFSTTNGLLQSTAGADINAGGGAGTASIRLESLNASGALTINGSVTGAAGSLSLRAGGDLTVNAPLAVSTGAVILHANTDGGGLGNLFINAAINLPSASSVSLQGVQFTQSGTGTLTTGTGAITGLFRSTASVNRAISTHGGVIRLTAQEGITVNALITTAPPAGGSGRLYASKNVLLNTQPLPGNADIILIGGAINAPVVVEPSTTDLSGTTARLQALLKDDGGMPLIERGFLIAPASLNPDPLPGGKGVMRWISEGDSRTFDRVVTDLKLGTTYVFRAFASNHAGDGFSQTSTFTLLSPIEAWRLKHFGTTKNEGKASDTATPDDDDIPNLIKYGLVLTPGEPLASDLATPRIVKLESHRALALDLRRDPARSDIIVFIEGSSDLFKWTEIASSRLGSPFEGEGNVEEKEDRGGIFNCTIADVADAESEPFRFLRVRVENGRSE